MRPKETYIEVDTSYKTYERDHRFAPQRLKLFKNNKHLPTISPVFKLNESFPHQVNESDQIFSYENNFKRTTSTVPSIVVSVRQKRDAMPNQYNTEYKYSPKYQYYDGSRQQNNLFDDPAEKELPKRRTKRRKLTEKNEEPRVGHMGLSRKKEIKNFEVSHEDYPNYYSDYQKIYQPIVPKLMNYFSSPEYVTNDLSDRPISSWSHNEKEEPKFYYVYDDEGEMLHQDKTPKAEKRSNGPYKYDSKHSTRSTKQRSISIFPPSATSLSGNNEDTKGAILPPNYLEGVWEPEDFTLQIKFTERADEGTYICQINTEPRMSQKINLNVIGE